MYLVHITKASKDDREQADEVIRKQILKSEDQ